jgi:hypothetical protein
MSWAQSARAIVSRPANKLDFEVTPQARLVAHYEQKARKIEQLVLRLQEQLIAVVASADRRRAQQRISRLAGIAAENREKARLLASCA